MDAEDIILNDMLEYLKANNFRGRIYKHPQFPDEIVIRKPNHTAIIYLHQNNMVCVSQMPMVERSHRTISIADPSYKEKIIDWISSKFNIPGERNGSF